jgi:hypothetical protein
MMETWTKKCAYFPHPEGRAERASKDAPIRVNVMP